MQALAGDLTGAIGSLLEVADLQALEGQHGHEIYTLHDALRLGAVAEAGHRLGDAVMKVDGNWSSAFVAHLEAVRSGSGAAYEHAAETFAAMGANLHAAEAAAAAGRAY